MHRSPRFRARGARPSILSHNLGMKARSIVAPSRVPAFLSARMTEVGRQASYNLPIELAESWRRHAAERLMKFPS